MRDLSRLFAPRNHHHADIVKALAEVRALQALPPQVAAGNATAPLIPGSDSVVVRVALNRSMRTMTFDVVPNLLPSGRGPVDVSITATAIPDPQHVDITLTNGANSAVPAGIVVQVIAVAGAPT